VPICPESRFHTRTQQKGRQFNSINTGGVRKCREKPRKQNGSPPKHNLEEEPHYEEEKIYRRVSTAPQSRRNEYRKNVGKKMSSCWNRMSGAGKGRPRWSGIAKVLGLAKAGENHLASLSEK